MTHLSYYRVLRNDSLKSEWHIEFMGPEGAGSWDRACRRMVNQYKREQTAQYMCREMRG